MAAVQFHAAFDNHQAQAVPGDIAHISAAMKRLKQPGPIRLRNTDPLVHNPHRDAFCIERSYFHRNAHLLVGILYGIIDQIRDSGANLVRVACNPRALATEQLSISQRISVKVITEACEVETFTHQLAQIDYRRSD